MLLALSGCGARTALRVDTYDATAADAAVPDARRPDAFVPEDAFVPSDALTRPDVPGIDAAIPPVCEPGRFPLAFTTAELMLVIDRSGSMNEDLAGNRNPDPRDARWTFLRAGLDAALADLDPRVLVGAKFFPDSLPTMDPTAACTATSGIDVPVGTGTRPAILSVFDARSPRGGTPTAVALRQAADGLPRTSPRRYLVLATDGGPNCDRDPVIPPGGLCVCTGPGIGCADIVDGVLGCLDDVRTVEAITEILDGGVPTYVIGIEDTSRPDLSDVLDAMAVAGGRPRQVPGERRFYSVRSADQLRSALDDVTASIAECGIVTPTLPDDDALLTIEIDGRRFGSDAWIWTDRTWGELELTGEACALARAPGARVEAVVDTCAR